MRKTESAVTNGETREDGVKSYPCGSAPVWKTLAEVLGRCQSGCSQCAAAMGRSDGASQRHSGGVALRPDRRASPRPDGEAQLLVSSGSSWRLDAVNPPGFSVLRVATWRKWPFSSTIEL